MGHCRLIVDVLIIFISTSTATLDDHIPKVCSYASCQQMSNSSSVFNYCKTQNMTISGRCCFNSTTEGSHTLAGIDLSFCNISREQLKTFKTDLKMVQYLVLDANPLYNCSVEDFRGLTDLYFLSVPTTCSCPGELTAWEDITIQGNITTCQGQITCRQDLVPCPASSHCSGNGPGLAECSCDEGHHGYKCSRQGKFPTAGFAIGLISSTIVAAGVMWCTHRRHTKME